MTVCHAGAGLSGERGKLAGRCAELEADLAAASAEVDELRQLLDGVMTEKAALAARCSSLESQVWPNIPALFSYLESTLRITIAGVTLPMALTLPCCMRVLCPESR